MTLENIKNDLYELSINTFLKLNIFKENLSNSVDVINLIKTRVFIIDDIDSLTNLHAHCTNNAYNLNNYDLEGTQYINIYGYK